MSKLRKIASHVILTPNGLCPRGLITIDEDGRVVSVESGVEDIDSRCGVEFYAGILIPGMINAHCHLELSFAEGQIPEKSGFAGFAKGLSETRSRVTDKEKQRAVSFYDASMWREGVSAVGDISNTEDSFLVKASSSIRYHTFAEAYGLRRTSLSDVYDLRDKALKVGLKANISPHSTYSLNDKLFREATGEDDSLLSTHFMESVGESELFKGEGDMAAWYADAGFVTDFTDKYDSPADRVVSCVPSDRRVMLIHNTCIDKRETETLSAHFGENITWVLCPRSNRFITGEMPPVDMLRETGGRIALGTDSLASNHSLSMIEELKTFEDVPLEELLRWATINGAEALRLGDELGSFEVGKRPGVVLLEGVDLKEMKLTAESTTRRLV